MKINHSFQINEPKILKIVSNYTGGNIRKATKIP